MADVSARFDPQAWQNLLPLWFLVPHPVQKIPCAFCVSGVRSFPQARQYLFSIGLPSPHLVQTKDLPKGILCRLWWTEPVLWYPFEFGWLRRPKKFSNRSSRKSISNLHVLLCGYSLFRHTRVIDSRHGLRSFCSISRDPDQMWSGIYACKSNTSGRDTDMTIAPCGGKTLFHILDLSLCFPLQIDFSVHTVVQYHDQF